MLEEDPRDAGSTQRADWRNARFPSSEESGTAAVEMHAPGGLRIRTRSDQDAFLVLSEVFYPGWEATLDGKPASIMRGDYIFRTVYVPRGEHVVLLRYRPLSLRVGAGITALSLVLVLALAVAAHSGSRGRL